MQRREGRKINCTLQAFGGLPFSKRYQTAHTEYDKNDLKRIAPDGVINFHKPLYMEIQSLAAALDGRLSERKQRMVKAVAAVQKRTVLAVAAAQSRMVLLKGLCLF